MTSNNLGVVDRLESSLESYRKVWWFSFGANMAYLVVTYLVESYEAIALDGIDISGGYTQNDLILSAGALALFIASIMGNRLIAAMHSQKNSPVLRLLVLSAAFTNLIGIMGLYLVFVDYAWDPTGSELVFFGVICAAIQRWHGTSIVRRVQKEMQLRH